MRWLWEGPAQLSLLGFGEKDLVLWVDHCWALRGSSPPWPLPITCCSYGGQRPMVVCHLLWKHVYKRGALWTTIAPSLLSVPSSAYLKSSCCPSCCCLQGGPWKVATHDPLPFLDSTNDLWPFYASLALLLDINVLEHDAKFLCFSAERRQTWESLLSFSPSTATLSLVVAGSHFLADLATESPQSVDWLLSWFQGC